MTVLYMVINYSSQCNNFRFGIAGLALEGGHTHPGCTDAIGKMCLNPH